MLIPWGWSSIANPSDSRWWGERPTCWADWPEPPPPPPAPRIADPWPPPPPLVRASTIARISCFTNSVIPLLPPEQSEKAMWKMAKLSLLIKEAMRNLSNWAQMYGWRWVYTSPVGRQLTSQICNPIDQNFDNKPNLRAMRSFNRLNCWRDNLLLSSELINWTGKMLHPNFFFSALTGVFCSRVILALNLFFYKRRVLLNFTTEADSVGSILTRPYWRNRRW